MKQTLAPGAKGLHVVSQAPLTAAQKSKLKEAGGGTFRFVRHSDKYHQCLLNIDFQIVQKPLQNLTTYILEVLCVLNYYSSFSSKKAKHQLLLA